MIEEIKQAAKTVEEMNRATEEKEKELSNQFGAIGFSKNAVQFQTAYDVENATGKTPSFIKRDNDMFPYEALVVIDGFRFFALLSINEMEEYENERKAVAN